MPIVGYILTAVAAYLLGSIPTGFLVGKARGIDIRKVGSGNIGATNVFRALGTPAGIFVLLVDTLKGLFAVAVMAGLFCGQFWPDAGSLAREWFRVVAGGCAIPQSWGTTTLVGSGSKAEKASRLPPEFCSPWFRTRCSSSWACGSSSLC